MANLETIMAETNKSYDNSRNALNNQINAIAGDLEAQKSRLNANYAQQQKSLDNQRNQAAAAASMNAARTGGSFGGKSAIANDKYYQQVYTPAVTQMQTNQANDMSAAEQQANQNRLSLQQTLAQLNDEANRYALQRYDAAVQAEKEEAYRKAQLELQRQQLAAQKAYQNYLMPQKTATNPYGYAQDASGGTQFYNNDTGANVTFGTYAGGAGAKGNSQLMALASSVLNSNDYNRLARIVGAQGSTSHSALKTTPYASYQNANYLSQEDNDFMRRLGLTF